MRGTHPRELQFYKVPNGKEPFTEWFIVDFENKFTLLPPVGEVS